MLPAGCGCAEGVDSLDVVPDPGDDEGTEVSAGSEGAGRPARKPSFFSRSRVGDAILALDRRESRMGWAAVVLMALMVVALIPHLQHKTISFVSESLVHGKCRYGPYPGEPKGCNLELVNYPADYIAPLVAVLVFLACSVVAILRSRRSLLAFATLLSGFTVFTLVYPPVGLLLLIFGGWLMLRAWRLQRYGVADAKSVRGIVAERSAERAAQRKAAKESRRSGTKAAAAPGGAESATSAQKRVSASKRYTPKAQSRRRK